MIIMNELEINEDFIKCRRAAIMKSEDANSLAISMEIGKKIITGKESELLSAPSALIINVINIQRYEVFSITKASDHAKITKCVQKRLKGQRRCFDGTHISPLVTVSPPGSWRGGGRGGGRGILIGRQRPPRDVEAFAYGHCPLWT